MWCAARAIVFRCRCRRDRSGTRNLVGNPKRLSVRDALTWLFSSNGFMPHGHCFLWQPSTLWLNVGSDALIALAYVCIPFAIYYFVRQRKSAITYPGIALMFAAFIFLCGATHVLEVWTVWDPVYRVAGALKMVTGVVSFLTLVAVIRIMPQAILLKTPGEMKIEVEARTAELVLANRRLLAEIAARDAAERQLRDTERKRAQSDILLRTIVDSAPGMIYAKDREGRLLLANAFALSLIGRPWEEVEGLTEAGFLEDQQQAAAVMRNDQRLMDGEIGEEVEEVIGTKDGEPRVWVSIKAPLRNQEANVVGLVGVSFEITERKRLERSLKEAYEDMRRTHQAIVRHEKLRVLGQLASGLAHDINNALSPAALYVAILQRDARQSEAARGYLEIVHRAIEGVAQTVTRMKETSTEFGPQAQIGRVDLNAVIRAVIELTRAKWSAAAYESRSLIHERLDLENGLPAVMGDEGELRDALINLVLNATDAMPAGGTLTVRSRSLDDGRVQIEVIDTGTGMDEATKRRCLELYFTTKGAQGTGLGLPMVYGTVERHGGELEIVSEIGRGTSVHLRFAAVDLPPASVDEARESPDPEAGLRVLVIDDDPVVLESLRTTLNLEGHSTAVADGGQAGIDAFETGLAQGRPFAVVITDLGMPAVDGRRVAAAIKALRSATRVILLTGWGHEVQVGPNLPPHIDRIMTKPPRLSELRAILNSGTPARPPA
jgi:PAS domain S-box-containing protein